eukprot:478824-Prymnesium_polylepis.1
MSFISSSHPEKEYVRGRALALQVSDHFVPRGAVGSLVLGTCWPLVITRISLHADGLRETT